MQRKVLFGSFRATSSFTLLKHAGAPAARTMKSGSRGFRDSGMRVEWLSEASNLNLIAEDGKERAVRRLLKPPCLAVAAGHGEFWKGHPLLH